MKKIVSVEERVFWT